MKTWLAVALLSSVATMWGCGQDDSGVEVIQPTERLADRDTAEQVDSSRKIYRPPVHELIPDPEPPLVMINNGAGILNPDFNDHIDQVPTRWDVRGGVRVITGTHDNSKAVACLSGVTLTQVLPFDESPAGKTVRLIGHAQTPLPDAVTVRIKLDNGATSISEPHPADDQWHELSTEIQIPDDYDSNNVTIVLSCSPKVRSNRPVIKAWFDDVNLTVTE